MSYRIAGVDVHKKMLAVVVSGVEVDGHYQFERRTCGYRTNHPRFQAIAFFVEETGECGEQELNHRDGRGLEYGGF